MLLQRPVKLDRVLDYPAGVAE